MTTERPTTLLAELTHRCPLHCPYCSNPLEMIRAQGEMGTDDWKRVFTQARALGVLQLGLSGGEPMIRKDLEELATHARGLGLYTTLVTSGRGRAGEGAGLRPLDQRGPAPRQSRSHRDDHRSRRRDGGRPDRAGEYPVL